ncbi:phage terminase large subunit [Shimia sagamensis]|uniref:Phage terminase large subunit n=1 Tax=Shimia sagamensis TaxID=1566352 RepID=A0ABY1PLL2_9RHOB|nr:phage terminase large subunit [Shimia sagamensis]
MRFLCARQFQNKIAESVYTLLKIQIARFGLEDDFEITRDSIRHKRTGSEFLFYGLWRHIDEIKSLEGIDVCWIEEAHGLTKEQWEILEPTLRGEASQFWIIFNPKLVTDFVYRTFVTGTPSTRIKGEIYGVVGDTIKRRINYDENPFLTQTMLRVIAKKKQTDPEGFVNIYGGEPIEDDDQVIIKRSWIRAAIDAHKKLGIKPTGRRRIGFDVADSGEDKNALVEAYGILTVGVEEWAAGEDQLLKSATRVHARARQVSAEIDYDSIGVGAFAGGHFQALNQSEGTSIEYRKFNASGEVLNKGQRIDANDDNSPLNEDFYCNLKAQAWWEVATRFRNTFNAVERQMTFPEEELIAISSDCDHLEDLIDELSTPRKDVDTRGKSKVESKKDLAKRDIASPNKADAFIMANGPRDASTYDLGSLL